MADLTTRAIDYLSPLIGSMMAKSSVELHLKKMGVAPGQLKAADMPKLATLLGPGLKVFVGAEKAKTLTETLAKFS